MTSWPVRRVAVRALTILLSAIVLGAVGVWAVEANRERIETARLSARFEPPVLAGQNVPGACSGGFYARHGAAIVLTIVGHCAIAGTDLLDASGARIGTFGQPAQLTDCPTDRFCAPSDFLALELAPDHIPWGHLNLVDMGAGGYREVAAGAHPLSCADIRIGDRVEVDGREHYRSGVVVATGRYEHPTDIIFPCMIVTDIVVVVGDSGGAVLVNGAPAGIISRSTAGRMGFTPLAEGLVNLGLTLCTTPTCGLSAPPGA